MSFLNSLNGYLDIPNANLRVNGSGQFSSINVGSTRILAGYDPVSYTHLTLPTILRV